VVKEGFQPVAAPPAPDSKDSTTFKVTAGGFLSAGNSRSLAVTGVADYFLRRGPSQFGAQVAANYGQAPGPTGSLEDTVENYQARVRYDHFFAGGLAGFLSVQARRDEFQQLDLRLNVDPGLAYYFIDEKDERLWAELGYDLQHDVRRQELLDANPSVGRSETRHNVRVFAGYDNQVLEAVKFNAGVEYLQNIPETENARLNIDLGLTTQINTSFSIGTTVAIKYDNNPLPAVKSTDVVTALNLVYTLSH
jgi:putative salt-induced outer membrane protein